MNLALANALLDLGPMLYFRQLKRGRRLQVQSIRKLEDLHRKDIPEIISKLHEYPNTNGHSSVAGSKVRDFR